jgi:hypothetical protein
MSGCTIATALKLLVAVIVDGNLGEASQPGEIRDGISGQIVRR